jgi:DNA-directed RNA polymerase subunit RPC12/RpoP
MSLSTETFYICEDCETVLDEEPEGPAYECGSCGETFSREMTENGDHRCPQCNKFGGKAGDYGCPECGGQMEAVEGVKCPHCEKVVPES